MIKLHTKYLVPLPITGATKQGLQNHQLFYTRTLETLIFSQHKIKLMHQCGTLKILYQRLLNTVISFYLHQQDSSDTVNFWLYIRQHTLTHVFLWEIHESVRPSSTNITETLMKYLSKTVNRCHALIKN